MIRPFLLLCVLLCACGGSVLERAASGSPDQGSSSADSCLSVHEQIIADLSAIARSHEKGCSSDADCALLELTIPCQDACAMPVLQAQHSAATAEVAKYAAQVCPDAPTSCGVSSYCAPTHAACVSGACSSQF